MGGPSIDNWPDYLPGPRDHLQALGVISLLYGSLEGLFQVLFASVTYMSEEQVSALFQRIPNNTQQGILTELMEQAGLPPNVEDAIRHFCTGFNLCAANRHALMHCRSGGVISDTVTGHYGFVFTKLSRAGNRLVCTPGLKELKAAADAIYDYFLFAAWLNGDVLRARYWIPMPGEQFALSSSTKKPPLPLELSWRAEEEFQAEVAQRKSSPQ